MDRRFKANWLLNLLLSSLFVFAVLFAVERLVIWDTGWYKYVKHSWPALFGFLFGMAGNRRKKLDYVLVPVSCLITGLLISPFLRIDFSLDILYLIIACAMTVFLYYCGKKSNEVFPSKLAVISLVCYLAEIVIFSTQKTANVLPFNIIALGTFFVILFSLNNESLQSGVHNVKGGTVMRVPERVRFKNIILLAVFLVLALLVGNIRGIHSFFIAAVKSAAIGIWKLIELMGGVSTNAEPAAIPAPEVTEEPVKYLEPDIPPSPVVIIFIVVIVAMFLIGVIFTMRNKVPIMRAVRRLIKKRKDIGQLDREYEEDIERVFSIKDVLKKRRRRFSDFFGRLFIRAERISDMPDNRMKVRFAYKALLKRLGAAKNGMPETPLEVGSSMPDHSISKLAADYSFARYCDIVDVPDEAADNAVTAVGRISRYKGKRINEGN